ncbi:hypothetical protein [Streptomyces sp. NPDC005955]|uniref:hypothetical protein n=1 Tax=Streptomyces sp. NPDC005955 TaxID=3364738 RepID=UPI0036BCE347
MNGVHGTRKWRGPSRGRLPRGVSAARSRAGAFLAAAVAALALLFGPGVSPAAAGGDTSVLLVALRSSQATALLAGDERYGELLGLLPQSIDRGRERPVSEAELEEARQITATWMAHEVSAWRIDRVHVLPADRRGGAPDVWIETGWDGSLTHAQWHRAVYPTELLEVLKSLGLLGRTADADATTGPTTATGEGARTAPVAAVGPGAARPWWWAGAGVAVGAPLALLLRSFAGRLRTSPATGGTAAGARGEREPRQELRDR